ncbi:spore protease YyaC [Priestia flexa]|nr:spore protease YyaC [Priestia flexa]
MGSFFKRTEVEKKESATTAWTVKAGSSQKEMEVEYASTQLFDIIQKAQLVNRDIVFLCIGSDRYVGDSLGTLVGTMLVEEGIPFEVYGTLEHPVHAFNLKEIIKEVNKRFVKPFIISIDACLGEQSQVGDVMIKEEYVGAGASASKSSP